MFDKGQASTIAIVDAATGNETTTWRGAVRATAIAFVGSGLFIGKADGSVERCSM